MNENLFKVTYPYICSNCGAFAHTIYEFCEKCGEPALRKAKKEDYKNHKNSK